MNQFNIVFLKEINEMSNFGKTWYLVWLDKR